MDTQEIVEFWCWLAGFIDGEGTISITKRNPQAKNRTYYPTYRAYLAVVTTSPEVMFYIKQTVDKLLNRKVGSFGEYPPRKDKVNIHRNSIAWSISKFKDLSEILEKIIPHLILKRGQAELVLSFVHSRLKIKHSRPFEGSNITAGEITTFNKVRALNSRGKGRV